MASSGQGQPNLPHFVLFPFTAFGHMIPLVDAGKMLAQLGVKVTVFATATIAARFETNIEHAKEDGLPIQIIKYPFAGKEVGLPQEYEIFDMTWSQDIKRKFISAANMSTDIVEKMFQELFPKPYCIVFDLCLPYAAKIAAKFNIPSVTFHVLNCFNLLCMFKAHTCKVFEKQDTDTMDLVISGLHDKVEINKKQISICNPPVGSIFYEILEADAASYGAIVNTFEDLEPAFVKEYKKVRRGKVWCIGPVSLGVKEYSDMDERGNKSSINGNECLKWLDSWESSSVLYACFGSLCRFSTAQMMELGLGLEASNRPFIWVIGSEEKSPDLHRWIVESGFEERIKGRGLLIKGWAPQLLILSHPAIGGFMTHLGGSSVLEAVSAGLPMITFPMFGDQFLNEKLVVEDQEVGVNLGIKDMFYWGSELGVTKIVKKENFERAIECLFMEGEESVKRRERAKELQKLARKAHEKDGSSYLDLRLFIQDILQQKQSHN